MTGIPVLPPRRRQLAPARLATSLLLCMTCGGSAAAEDVSPTTVVATPLQVTVRGAQRGQRLREGAQAIKVIDTDEARRRTDDLGSVLARTEGLAVQRSGGLGSETRVSLHGLTGDQIRVYLDGVPLEFSGFGLGLSTVPVNWTQRVEVFRGVVPVRFGADALGGAIDIVTESATAPGNALSASYSGGSFETHQLGANGRLHRKRSGFVLRAAALFDASANDYVVRVRVPDVLGRLRTARVRRFHDGYRARGALAEVGLVNRPWAQRLTVRLFATDFDKDLQHNADMSVPYGRARYGQTALGGVLRYEQPRRADRPATLGVLLGYSRRRLDFEDRSPWIYDWFGNRVFERPAGSGEVSPNASDLSQWDDRAIGRATLTYDAAPGHELRWVVGADLTLRSGQERLRARQDRIDPLTTRRELFQLTSGLEYTARDAADTVENRLFGKYYFYRPSADQVDTFENAVHRIEDRIQRAGVGDAFRVRLLDWLIGKLSYEYATRLPSGDEVFGDGVMVLPNLGLNPETSHNGNVGAIVSAELASRAGMLSLEPTVFLRYTENMVVRLLAEDRVHLIHQNLFTVRTVGVDGALAWTAPARWVTLQTNATWQDQRNASTVGDFAHFRGQRVPNRPWLFANATALLRIPRLGADNAELSLFWTTRYARAFFPGWVESASGESAPRVPSQLTHSFGAVYSVAGPWRIDLALDVTNLTNERVFDVLGVQRPGRAAFFKVTVCWTSTDSSGEASSDESVKGIRL